MDNNTKYGVFKNKVSAKKLAMGEIKGRMVTVAKGIQIEAKPGKTDEETITAYKLKHNIS